MLKRINFPKENVAKNVCTELWSVESMTWSSQLSIVPLALKCLHALYSLVSQHIWKITLALFHWLPLWAQFRARINNKLLIKSGLRHPEGEVARKTQNFRKHFPRFALTSLALICPCPLRYPGVRVSSTSDISKYRHIRYTYPILHTFARLKCNKTYVDLIDRAQSSKFTQSWVMLYDYEPPPQQVLSLTFFPPC